jgi:CHAT domain-containing protein
MRAILCGFLALVICLSSLTVKAVSQQTHSSINPLFLGMNQVDELLAQTQEDQKAEIEKLEREAEWLYVSGHSQYIESDIQHSVKEVLPTLQRRLAIYREIGDREGEERALHDLGYAYYSLGDFAEAIDCYQQSFKLFWRIKKSLASLDFSQKERVAQRLIELGNAFHLQKNYHEALNHYQQSLAISQELEPSEDSTGLASKDAANSTKAYALGSLGNAYHSLKQYKKAIEYYRQALAIETNIEYQNLVLENLGAALLDSGNFIEAEKTLLTVVEQAESETSRVFGIMGGGEYVVAISSRQIRPYNLLQQFYIAQNRPNEALEIAERGRVRVFINLLARQSEFQSGTPLSVNSPTLEQIQQIATQQKATIVNYSISYDDKTSHGGLKFPHESELFIWVIKPNGEVFLRHSNIKPQQQQQQSSKLINSWNRFWQVRIEFWGYLVLITTLILLIVSFIGLVFLRRQQRLAAILITLSCTSVLVVILMQKQPTLLSRGNSEVNSLSRSNSALKELVSTAYGAIGVRNRSLSEVVKKKQNKDIEEHLHQLYQLLIQPIDDLLPANADDRIIFIPQNDLFLVPFPALKDTQGQYLIEKHTILTSPAIQVLEFTHKQLQRVSGAASESLVVGNPVMPETMPVHILGEPPESLTLEALPAAEQEAQDIANLLGTQPLIGNQATETEIVQQLPSAKIIHLATHGLPYDFPGGIGPGAIALAPSDKDDGFLSTGEISDLRLNAGLVVLSACQTALGRTSIDGVVGLSRSFFAAGVPSIVVSIWKVPDAPTALLMTNFYKNLLQQKLDKAQALRQAMLTTMKQYPDPNNWAAFTLIGEAE